MDSQYFKPESVLPDDVAEELVAECLEAEEDDNNYETTNFLQSDNGPLIEEFVLHGFKVWRRRGMPVSV